MSSYQQQKIAPPPSLFLPRCTGGGVLMPSEVICGGTRCGGTTGAQVQTRCLSRGTHAALKTTMALLLVVVHFIHGHALDHAQRLW